MLVNRLQNHAGGRLEMSTTQIRAAEVLLKKCVPDLSSTALTNEEGDGPPVIEHVIRFVNAPGA